jgi:hypothetical protein
MSGYIRGATGKLLALDDLVPSWRLLVSQPRGEGEGGCNNKFRHYFKNKFMPDFVFLRVLED